MRRGDRGWILFPVFHQHQVAAVFQCPADASKHLSWMLELVVSVQEQCKINAPGEKIRVGICAENQINIRQMFCLGAIKC